MVHKGFNVVLRRAPPASVADEVWKMRWLIAYTALDLGLQPLVVDSDLVVLRDPFSALAGDADLEFSTDHYFPDRHLWQPWTRAEEHPERIL